MIFLIFFLISHKISMGDLCINHIFILLNMRLGVCLSHSALLTQAATLALRSDDMVLIFSSLYWISGTMLLISSAIKGFCRLITTESFSVDLFLDMVEAHPVRKIS